ncbi:MAG: hypothetical protein ACI4F4_10710 [Lachnospiraceae bacterium]
MAFISELLTYLFKFIILGAVAVAGVLCGAKMKKNKNAKEASGSEMQDNA